MSSIQSVMHESRVFEPRAEWVAQANVKKADYDAMCAKAASNFEGFWAELARDTLAWHKPFTKVLDESSAPFYKWFEDGEMNVSYNCLDRNLENGNADKVAIIFEADDGKVTKVTYRELHQRVCRFANGLKSLGIKKGDRVVIYMPMSIEGVVAMQACARIGATHSVVFGGFSAKSLQERIIDAGAVAVITADEQMRGGKAAAAEGDRRRGARHGRLRRHPQRHRLSAHRRQRRVLGARATSGCTSSWRSQADTCEPEWVGAEHPLFILYTSGSTGKPKGVQHSSGGYLLWAALTMKWVFDIKPSDVFWCTADIGWVTGHTYITYGPLAVGATEVVFEGIPTYPDAGRFWKMIAEAQGQRLLHGADRDPLADQGIGRASRDARRRTTICRALRLLGTVGEPINPEAWMWYHKQRRRRALPDRRHVVADRNRRPHDLAAAGRDADSCRARARCRCRASWRRSSTRPATTSRTVRAAFWSSSGRGRR